MTRPHIRWTYGEWKCLALRWKELVEAGLSNKAALNKAQLQLLPEHRRRNIVDTATVYSKFITHAGEPDLTKPSTLQTDDVQVQLKQLTGKVAWLESELNTIKARLSFGNGAPKKHDPTPPSDNTPRRPKIAIVGIRPNQAAEIHHYEKEFDIRYYEPSANNFDWCAHAARVILMGTHVTYFQHMKLKRLGVQLLYNQSGAVSGLLPLLDNLKKVLHA